MLKDKIKTIYDFIFVPHKLVILIVFWFLINANFGIYTIEHIYYNDSEMINSEYLEYYDNEYNYYVETIPYFKNPYMIGIKTNMLGYKEPIILYPEYLHKTKGYKNNIYLLHQKTFLFSHTYNVTEQFLKKREEKRFYSVVTN